MAKKCGNLTLSMMRRSGCEYPAVKVGLCAGRVLETCINAYYCRPGREYGLEESVLLLILAVYGRGYGRG